MNLNEQPQEAIQTAKSVITEIPPAKRELVFLTLLSILTHLNAEGSIKLDSDKLKQLKNELKENMGDKNMGILLESLGFSLNDNEIAFKESFKEIAHRIDILVKEFEDDLTPLSTLGEKAEETRKEVHNVILLDLNMPKKLIIRMSEIDDGEMLTEGTILFAFGHIVFRQAGGGERVQWHNDELFKEFQNGTFVRIYKKSPGVEIKKMGN